MTKHEREWWREHDGHEVMIEGRKHRLRVAIYEAIYPYPHTACHVYAHPCDRTAQWYRDIKAALGDDWASDVLDTPESAAEVMRQLGWAEAEDDRDEQTEGARNGNQNRDQR